MKQNQARGLYAAEIGIRVGHHASFDAKVTSAGLLSVGVLVSGILLSTGLIVMAARTPVGNDRALGDDRKEGEA
jgi:hypothetical protein